MAELLEDEAEPNTIYCQSCDLFHPIDDCYKYDYFIGEDEEPYDQIVEYYCPEDDGFMCCRILDGNVIDRDKRYCDLCDSDVGPFFNIQLDEDEYRWYCSECYEGATGRHPIFGDF